MSVAGRRLFLPAAAALLLLAAPPGRAHIVYGQATLRQLAFDADLVARARILDPSESVAAGEGGDRRPLVRAELLEVLKGEAESRLLRFARHGHGTAEYAEGEEVVIFLRRIGRSRELAALAGSVGWVSLQEHDAKLLLTDAERGAVLETLRGYLEAEAQGDPEARAAALARTTIGALRSPVPRLASWALTDLVLLGDGLRLGEEELEALESLPDDPGAPIGVRIGVLTELERRSGAVDPERWVRLLRETRGRERSDVIRAVATRPSPAVASELLRILDGEDPRAAALAAISLGWPGNRAAVAPLAEALREGDGPLRNAAIRGLGRIGGEEAAAALAAAAESHPDPETRRRARAALTRLDR